MSFSRVLTVSQVNTYLKAVMDEDKVLSSVLISGEISNFTNHYRSGHFYFTLKDENALIKCVMFKSSAARVRFEPENGMQVIIHGRVSVFERDGQYQVYADSMQPDGAGSLSLAFEQMKKRLAAKGWFDESIKKEIPRIPERVGVITSPTGAAVRDIFQISARRFPYAEIVFCPVKVQGTDAAAEIAGAIERFNRLKACDVLIVGRGGGSVEELWAFNEECVAKAIYESEIPVISAVGHETDFTICDFVADLRAPTPSAAAELALPDRLALISYISTLKRRMYTAAEQKIQAENEKITRMKEKSVLHSPMSLFEQRRQMLDGIAEKAADELKKRLERERAELSSLCGKLHALSPLQVLSRGYAIAQRGGSTLCSAADVSGGDEIEVKLKDGIISCSVNAVNLTDMER